MYQPDFIFNKKFYEMETFKKMAFTEQALYGIMSPITGTWAFNIYEQSPAEAKRAFGAKVKGLDIVHKIDYYVELRTKENGGLK